MQLLIARSNDRQRRSRRWGYLLVALILLLVTAAVTVVWLLSSSTLRRARPEITATQSVITLPTITLTPTPTPTSAPTPAVSHPTITDLSAQVDDEAQTITFHLAAEVPPGRDVAEVLLWYDTEIGRQVQYIGGPLPGKVSLSHRLDATQEGLTRTVTTTAELDYWWLVRDSTGESIRAGGTAVLGPGLQALVAPHTPKLPPVDFTWTVSESQHFRFYYMAGSAAERDISQLANLAEASLARIASVLETDFDGHMSIYLVPRVFWQGGATYGNKIQLISYLDRNYTGVETWSYFTHEGTHALAQDLLQPKEKGGGPDGVLVEGLAVWASDGHYGQEPIDAWATIVADSDSFVPLSNLRSGPFYEFQHETSYLQSGSFVKFLIERYGLDRLKELYGQATGDTAHDEALVQSLYGAGYEALEADWLAYLSGLNPTPEQAETWKLLVRSFDLMRRYQTELDPDARLLPPSAPPQWTSDTLKVFLGGVDAPVNIVLETALMAAQERLYNHDPEGAAALLNDIEAALDAGGTPSRPSLQARSAILDLLISQDRAVLRADVNTYHSTLDPAYALTLAPHLPGALQVPFSDYHQEIVRLDLSKDGKNAHGIVLTHVQTAAGTNAQQEMLGGRGQLFAVSFSKVAGGWVMSNRQPTEPALFFPPDTPHLVWDLVWPAAVFYLHYASKG